MKKQKITLLSGCVIEGKDVKKGSTVEVLTSTAQMLIGSGAAVEVKKETPKKQTVTKK